MPPVTLSVTAPEALIDPVPLRLAASPVKLRLTSAEEVSPAAPIERSPSVSVTSRLPDMLPVSESTRVCSETSLPAETLRLLAAMVFALVIPPEVVSETLRPAARSSALIARFPVTLTETSLPALSPSPRKESLLIMVTSPRAVTVTDPEGAAISSCGALMVTLTSPAPSTCR